MTSSDDLEAQIEALIKEIDDDERSHYPSATTDENAVLALIQCNMEGKMDGLKECLKLAKAHLDRDRKMKAELANDINKALGMWSKTLRGLKPDRARLMGIDIAGLQTLVAKLEAADSKTEERKP